MFAITYKENEKSFVLCDEEGQLSIYSTYKQAAKVLLIISDSYENLWSKEKLESLSVEELEVALK